MYKQALQAALQKCLPKEKKHYQMLGVAIFIIGWSCLYYYQHTHKTSSQKRVAHPVVIGTAKKNDIPVYRMALGSVTPLQSITVKTQIDGQLQQVLFQEGQEVKAGQLLAEIDSRPYIAQLIQYQGQLVRDEALLANAKLDLERYQNLWAQDAISQQTLATQQSLVKQYEGTIEIDRGLIESTAVNLEYCKVRAPVDGRIGLRLVDPGNVVQTTDTTGIALINRTHPMTVMFSIAEDFLPEIMEEMGKGQPLIVDIFDRQQVKKLAYGELMTVDNQIDMSSGTVKFRAEFDNANGALFPNQFVNVRLLVKILPKATVVPTAAIQHSTKGNYVFVVQKNNTVAVQYVTAGITVDDRTVITEGIAIGDKVVIEGADKLIDGAHVAISRDETKNTAQKKSEQSSHV